LVPSIRAKVSTAKVLTAITRPAFCISTDEPVVAFDPTALADPVGQYTVLTIVAV
jgi:hypothetical protein